MKALPINVYRTQSYSDCTNGGITSRYNRLLLVCDEGHVEVDENNPPENLVVMVTRNLGFTVYKHIEPYASTDKGCVGWMAGGNLAYTSDSRFKSEYPLCVHDRQETQDLYDAMFD
jgi:hypothetical protein